MTRKGTRLKYLGGGRTGEPRVRAQTRRRGRDPGDAARADAEGRAADAVPDQAKAGKGKAPGRMKPKRARGTKACRDAESSSQRDGGRKPLQRGRAGPAVRIAAAITNGPSMIRIVPQSGRIAGRQLRNALKPKGQGGKRGPGRREPPDGNTGRSRDAAVPIARGEAAPRGESDPRRVML